MFKIGRPRIQVYYTPAMLLTTGIFLNIRLISGLLLMCLLGPVSVRDYYTDFWWTLFVLPGLVYHITTLFFSDSGDRLLYGSLAHTAVLLGVCGGVSFLGYV